MDQSGTDDGNRDAHRQRQDNNQYEFGITAEHIAQHLDEDAKKTGQAEGTDDGVHIDEEPYGYPGQRGMSQCITNHGIAAQDEKHTNHWADDRNEKGHDKGILHKRIFKHMIHSLYFQKRIHGYIRLASRDDRCRRRRDTYTGNCA